VAKYTKDCAKSNVPNPKNYIGMGKMKEDWKAYVEEARN